MKMLKIGGKDYGLKYNFRALSTLQDYGVSFTSEQEYKLKDIVKLLEVGLKQFQPDVTFDGCFDLIDQWLEDNTLEDLMKALSQAMSLSLGKQNPMAQ